MAPLRKRTKLSGGQPTEILFDSSARQAYLTGFHKRKLARKEQAKEDATKREREEKIVERRQMREQRKEDLQQHVRDVNDEFKKMNPDLNSDDDGEVDHVTTATPTTAIPEEKEEEYVDEDKYTTVTVEPMDEESDHEDDEKKAAAAKADAAATKSRPISRPPKKKKKKFRYESKTDRKETRRKQKVKNSKEAKARKGE